MVGVYVAIAPSWWGTKHSSHVRKTKMRMASTLAWIQYISDYTACSVFEGSAEKTSENYDIYDPIKKG